MIEAELPLPRCQADQAEPALPVSLVLPLVQLVSIAAGYWMLKQQLRGWQLALVATLVGLIVNLLQISFLGVVVDLLLLYLLFQIRQYYQTDSTTPDPN